MTALNQTSFLPPLLERHENAACGRDPTSGGCNGGMQLPVRIHLRPGQTLFRFCDTRRAAVDLRTEAAGGWWIDYEVFARIRAFAREHAHLQDFAGQHRQSALSYAAKLHLAVPYEWGDSGVLVMADLVQPLDAFRGLGNTAFVTGRDPRDGGAKYIPLRSPWAYQLYIPDLRAHFARAFANLQRRLPGQCMHSHRAP